MRHAEKGWEWERKGVCGGRWLTVDRTIFEMQMEAVGLPNILPLVQSRVAPPMPSGLSRYAS